MTDLFWPGDERAGDLMGQPALLAAMARVEAAWLAALCRCGAAPAEAFDDLTGLVGAADVPAIAAGAEAGGNPVIPFVELLRARVRVRNELAATWLHRGLTSQDVLDTALVLCLREALDVLAGELRRHAAALADLAEAHRDTLMAGRTLTQPAVPITFGVKVATWLEGILDAHDDVRGARDRLAVQLGGAAGTMAAASELAGADRVAELVATTADRLGLPAGGVWHTNRSRITRAGDALVRCTDAWGRIANDVLTLSRPELGELSEGTGGGSSTMPHKANPVLSVLVRRAALSGPMAAAQLHLAAAEADDERPDGAWHTEWAALRDLARRTVVAALQTSALLPSLEVHAEAMKDNLAAALPGVLAEQRTMADLAGHESTADAAGYLGLAPALVDAAVERARRLR